MGGGIEICGPMPRNFFFGVKYNDSKTVPSSFSSINIFFGLRAPVVNGLNLASTVSYDI
jgi:hypothetical protein